uniref:SRCR domain-containing protein n=3 Tax=Magallana gigas TaxID=29159 RepID=A0A8W8NNA6_MAGGI
MVFLSLLALSMISIQGQKYDCPKWTYGQQCESCNCNQTTSASCHVKYGYCTCKNGYSGEFCNCKTGVHTCNLETSYCHTSERGEAVCLCKPHLSITNKEKCFNEYVRLTNQTLENEGVVEIYRDGVWGGICKKRLTAQEAQVVCRHFGLPVKYARIIEKTRVMPTSYFYWPNIKCNGTENSLLDCQRRYRKKRYCPEESAALITCPSNPPLRLVSNQTSLTGISGIPQLYYFDSWHNICDTGFDEKDGEVACRELGLPTKSITVYQGLEARDALFWDFRCTGNEQRLLDCRVSISNVKCSIVTLICDTGCSKWTHGQNCESCRCNRTSSAYCNAHNGYCTCKDGYTGEFCNCKTGVHNCNLKTSNCHTNEKGKTVCLCKPGLSITNKEECFYEYVRLTDQTPDNEGVVEIYRDGVWGGICKNRLTPREAEVICRHFGLPFKYARISAKNRFMPTSYFYWPNIKCNGTENSLLDCQRRYRKKRYCPGESAALVMCPSNPLIRLESNQTSLTGISGILQLYYLNSWLNICDMGFDEEDAKVACRELGLPMKYVTVNGGLVSRDAMFWNFRCKGNEKRLLDCRVSISNVKCSIVSITCGRVCPYMRYGKGCKLLCTCNNKNTLSCDPETGECICKPGFTGYSCNCVVGSHTCNTETSDCYRENNQTLCICKKGFTNYRHGCVDNVRLDDEGVVEMFGGTGWKGVCSYSTSSKQNAKVICRQLNLSTRPVYSNQKPAYGKENLQISISCAGDEETLTDCDFSYNPYCPNYQQIECGKCPVWKYSEDCMKDCECNKKTSIGCDVTTGVCVCHDGYGGTDCSWQTSVIPQCKEPSKINYDRCVCKQGSFNKSTNCSDLTDVIYSCPFEGYYWKEECNIELTNPIFIDRYKYYSAYLDWRPHEGSDNPTYVFVDTRQIDIPAEDYYTIIHIQLKEQRNHFCVYFDYVLDGIGSVEVYVNNIMNFESALTSIFGNYPNWTTRRVAVHESNPVNEIRFRMGERTAIDNIFLTESACDCANWTFGPSCVDCACVRVHTEFCDKANGQCHCKQGYTGEACQCEDNGEPCPKQLIRIVNGESKSSGRVEVVIDGIWSTVCDDSWNDNCATVVCRQLGKASYGVAVHESEFGLGVGPTFLMNMWCRGNETDLLNCKFAKADDCKPENTAGVICVDSYNNIRLVNGSDKSNGRLEVLLYGNPSWGTVCSDGFTEENARVACRQLSLPTRHVQFKTDAYYGEGSGDILITNLDCAGFEVTIQSCYGFPNSEYPYNCFHDQDVGISCSDDCPSFKYGAECENTCKCDQSKSISCDKDSGKCICEYGWKGTRCNCEESTECKETIDEG